MPGSLVDGPARRGAAAIARSGSRGSATLIGLASASTPSPGAPPRSIRRRRRVRPNIATASDRHDRRQLPATRRGRGGRSAASASSSSGAGARASNRCLLLGERRRRAASSRFRARAISSTIAASPNSAPSSFWLRNAVAAATPTSVPVRPAVWMNVASITPTPTALTPIDAPLASRRLPSPVSAMSVPIDAIHSSSRTRKRSSKPGRRAPQRRVGGHGIGDCAVLGPGRRGPASRLRGVQAGDRDQVIGRGLAHLGDGRVRWPEDAGDGSPHRADPSREDPGDVVCADVVLPVAEGFLAQERARA